MPAVSSSSRTRPTDGVRAAHRQDQASRGGATTSRVFGIQAPDRDAPGRLTRLAVAYRVLRGRRSVLEPDFATGRRGGGVTEPGRSPGVPVMASSAPAPAAPAAPASPALPTIRFGDGRRPETATQVQLERFDGPLALLLALIEARQLDVLTVPLGGLADAYLDALASLETDRLANVSAFVAVA